MEWRLKPFRKEMNGYFCPKRRIRLILFVLAVGFIPTRIEGNADAKKLYTELLSNYNKLIRPVGNNSDRLTVRLGLKLSQLIDVVSPINQSELRKSVGGMTNHGAPLEPENLRL